MAPVCLELRASRRARQARRLAIAVTGLALVGCAAAALLAPSPLRVSAAGAVLAVLVAAARPRPAAPLPIIAVDARGAVVLDDPGDPERAAVRYCATNFVCLQRRAGLLPLWPDSLPRGEWRRLLVACRWGDRDGRRGSGEIGAPEAN